MSPIIYLIIALVVLILAALAVYFANYQKVGPNEALIISGGKKRKVTLPDGSTREIGYRVRIGGGTFVKPFIEKTQVLPLEIIPMTFNVESAISVNGIKCSVAGTAEVKINGDNGYIHMAAEQFLGKPVSDIRDVALRTLEGSTRALIGTMKLESLNKNRKDFSTMVFEDTEQYFRNMGLKLLSYNLKEIKDPEGYLAALGKPRIVEARRDAEVAEAEAARDAIIKSAEAQKEGDIARIQAELEIAKAKQDYEIQKSAIQVELNQKKAEADFAYELQRHKLNQTIKEEEGKVKIAEKEVEIQLQEKEIMRTEKELEAKVRRPAEAEKFRIAAEAEGMAQAKRIQGEVEAQILSKVGKAEAEAIRQKAEAWNALSQGALMQMIIDKLPELTHEMAAPLSKVDKIVMVSNDGNVGTSKLTSEIASMLGQLPTVVKNLSGFDMEQWLKRLNETNPSEKREQEKPDNKK